MSPAPQSGLESGARLLVAIPAFNEAATISQAIATIPKQISGIDAVHILVVDDGSTDETARLAEQAGARVVRHSHNKGLGTAIKTAVDYAVAENYHLLVVMDADLQFNPQDIPTLVDPVLSGKADMVTASRFMNGQYPDEIPKIKLWGNRMMSRLISFLVRQRYRDVSCGFRCYSREALLRLNLHGQFTYTQETFLDLLSKQMRIVETPVVVRYFPDRRSRVAGSILRYAVNASAIIFRCYRDYFPLRFFWGISLVFLVPALILAAIFWGHFFVTGKFSGYLFAGFGGGFLLIMALIFFIIGLVADMLARIRANQERILYMLKKRDMP